MHRPFVGVFRQGRYACVAFGFATALTLGFSASAGAEDIACHGTEKQENKAAVKARPAPTPKQIAAVLAKARVIHAPEACPAIDEPENEGLIAVIDPQTGQLREPTAEEMRALRPATDRSRLERRAVTSSEPIPLPNGGTAREVGEEHWNDLVVRIGPDGQRILDCHPAGEVGNAPPAVAPTKEEK